MATALVANVLMFIIMISAVKFVAKLMYVPKSYLTVPIIIFCVIGSFATKNIMFDVWVMLGFGIMGYLLERAKVPLGPFVIGYLLAPLGERHLRSGLMASGDSYLPLITRPFSLMFVIISFIMLCWPFYREWRRKRVKDS